MQLVTHVVVDSSHIPKVSLYFASHLAIWQHNAAHNTTIADEMRFNVEIRIGKKLCPKIVVVFRELSSQPYIYTPTPH